MLGKEKQAKKKRKSVLDKHIDQVEDMDRKTYLKYYIKVLKEQIKQASKILKHKEKELKKLK